MCKLFYREKAVSIDRTNSLGLWRYGQEFYEAADKINKQAQVSCTLSVVAYYLICHSLELTMKAYLRGKGFSLDKLKKLGHNLEELLANVEKEKISDFLKISGENREAISMINPYYSEKEFEYIVTGTKTLPPVDILFEFANNLLSETKKFCEDNMNYHNGKPIANF